MKKKKLTGMWDEDNRPTSIDDMVLPSRIKNLFGDIENGIDQNYLFFGQAGVGKSTLARIIASKYKMKKKLDCSTDGGKAEFTSIFKNFANISSLTPHEKKFILLEEIDGISNASSKSAKDNIESCYGKARIVATTNEVNSIMDANLSRLVPISFTYSDQEDKDCKLQTNNRVKYICKKYGYTIDVDAVRYLLDEIYPDQRAIIKRLQSISKSLGNRKVIKRSDLETFSQTQHKYVELYDELLKTPKPEALYIFLNTNYKGREMAAINSLGTDFLKYLIKHDKYPILGYISQIVHKIQYEANDVPDKFNSLYALCTLITTTLSKI